jgi:hypothetical protein
VAPAREYIVVLIDNAIFLNGYSSRVSKNVFVSDIKHFAPKSFHKPLQRGIPWAYLPLALVPANLRTTDIGPCLFWRTGHKILLICEWPLYHRLAVDSAIQTRCLSFLARRWWVA